MFSYDPKQIRKEQCHLTSCVSRMRPLCENRNAGPIQGEEKGRSDHVRAFALSGSCHPTHCEFGACEGSDCGLGIRMAFQVVASSPVASGVAPRHKGQSLSRQDVLPFATSASNLRKRDHNKNLQQDHYYNIAKSRGVSNETLGVLQAPSNQRQPDEDHDSNQQFY